MVLNMDFIDFPYHCKTTHNIIISFSIELINGSVLRENYVII